MGTETRFILSNTSCGKIPFDNLELSNSFVIYSNVAFSVKGRFLCPRCQLSLRPGAEKLLLTSYHLGKGKLIGRILGEEGKKVGQI